MQAARTAAALGDAWRAALRPVDLMPSLLLGGYGASQLFAAAGLSTVSLLLLL